MGWIQGILLGGIKLFPKNKLKNLSPLVFYQCKLFMRIFSFKSSLLALHQGKLFLKMFSLKNKLLVFPWKTILLSLWLIRLVGQKSRKTSNLTSCLSLFFPAFICNYRGFFWSSIQFSFIIKFLYVSFFI